MKLWKLLGMACLSFVGTAVQAAMYSYDLLLDGTDLNGGSTGWQGSGHISFDALSGSTAANVTAFDFHVSSGPGSPQDYALGDISSVAWTIDGSTHQLTSLLLSSDRLAFAGDVNAESGILLTLDNSEVYFTPCFIGVRGSQTCVEMFPSDGGSIASSQGGVLTATPSEVPEPSTYALMLAGLGLLGFMAKRRKQ